MGYGLGVDLGTTFTAAAVSGVSASGVPGARMVRLGPEVVAPSVVFADPDGKLLTGVAAAARASSDPGRASHGHKRRLGDPTPIVIGGTAYSPEALLAAQLRDVIAAATAQEGVPPDTVALTCPAAWGPYRREQFEEVVRLAGLPSAHIVTEPEAAATHYTAERRLGTGETIAVYDLGGGTFDATILRATDTGMEILGTPEGVERLGGIDFDEALLAHVERQVPGADATVSRALCTKAKEDLSTEPDVTLPVPVDGDTRPLTITRVEFNEMIHPSVTLTTEVLRRTLSSAGLTAADLTGVLMAGGSSRIPLVPQVVSEAFGTPVRVSLHPKFTVALGAAEIARSTPAPAQPRAPRSALVAVPAEGTTPPARRRRWLPAVAVAAVAVLVTVVAVRQPAGQQQGRPAVVTGPASTSVKTSAAASVPISVAASTTTPAAGPVTTSADNPVAAPAPGPSTGTPRRPVATGPTLTVYDGRDGASYHGMLGTSADGWVGTTIGEDGTAAAGSISAAPGAGGLRVKWDGTASGQVYFQHDGGGSDLASYANGALVFDLVVHEPPATTTALAAHCVYPCAAELDATALFKRLPVGKAQTVKIPVSCFTGVGLDARKVNTPFLIGTQGRFEATFGKVEWVGGAGGDPDATPCGELG